MNYSPTLKYLSDTQLLTLHTYGVNLLKNIGMKVEDSDIRKLFCDNGCTEKEGRVYFSDEIIQKSLDNLKQEITMFAPIGQNSVTLKLGETKTHSTGGTPWIIDENTGKERKATLDDLINTIHVMNQLPELNIPCALTYPNEIPSAITQIVQTATMLEYSKKPIYGPGISMANNAKYIAKLFKIYGGENLEERPIGLVGISPESPLFLPKEITDTFRYISEAGIPISILAAPMGGLTSPLSVAGTVAQAHAEIIACTVLSYLINPKTVVFYGARNFFANMMSGQCILGLPETGIASAMAVQLANYCGFMTDVYGLSCTSCDFDEQAGYEKAINAILPALAGATLITGIGSTASVMCCSLGQLVIDNEIMRIIKKSMNGYEISDKALGLDALKNVVESGEIFLEQNHTVENLRTEVFITGIGFNGGMTDWVNSGKTPLINRAAKKAETLLKEDTPPEIPEEIRNNVDSVISKAKEELL